ncbi:MAG: transcription elongation factor GreA [Acidobacteriota bacterium]|nr:transcription elongation factor GreA [Acidobacteriota bacterium]MDE3031568.1 transcription elongation factor GreA [Acidobacteriota bacterium]MDE3093238.1 transcription elongation factor GreA [Acidobacteriota bacterium]MDE3140038.1 transcription elongation factor GreA [Acidobacteriota bacterium]MDE3146617.1 transcription elongation factor GreA [Acidobacteriota bacterium]
MAVEIHRITQETLNKLREEYHHLTTVGRTEIARVIEAARALGDLSENGDYHAAKDEQGKMESRIRQIDNVIRNHELVERDENADVAQHASIVQIVYEGDADDDFQEFFIGSIEEKPEGVLVASPTSPLGAALLGHGAGDLVEYEAPSGVLRVKIVGLR